LPNVNVSRPILICIRTSGLALSRLAGVPGVKPLLAGVYFLRLPYREVHPAAFRTARAGITPSELINRIAKAIRVAMPRAPFCKVIVTSVLAVPGDKREGREGE